MKLDLNQFRSPLCQKWIAFLNKEFISFLQVTNSPSLPPLVLPAALSPLPGIFPYKEG